ncbi:MAG: protein translocase subunit SecF [Halobacteriaceae archaeon]
MAAFDVPEVDYTRYTNRQLVAVPLAVLLVALAVLGGWYVATGSPVTPGIDFTGGTELTIETTASQGEVAAAFDGVAEPESIQQVQAGGGNTYIVTFQSTGVDALRSAANQLPAAAGNEDAVQSISATSAAFGAEAQETAVLGVVIAFAGMSVLAFLLFRTFVPSLAIVLSAFSDIVVPLAVLNIVGAKLSLGTVAGLLMIIGYSVDSDILLTNHVLRRSGDFYESAARAMRTGVTMTVTSIAAMAVMAIAAYLFGIDLLASIGLVLVVGLTTDLVNTYMFNYALLRWYKFEGVAQ